MESWTQKLSIAVSVAFFYSPVDQDIQTLVEPGSPFDGW